jgi:uncharacterized protein
MINPDSKLAAAFWKDGRVEDCPILDFHGHMGEWRSCFMPRNTPEGMLRTMDQCNVRMILFCGHEALHGICTRHALDIAAVRKYPGRFRAYFAINGNNPDQTGAMKRLQENRDVFVGLKTLGGYFNHRITSDVYTPFYEYAREERLLFLSHTWGDNPNDGWHEAERFLNKYPTIPFLAGHSFHGSWGDAARLCNDHPNLYLELTAVLDDRGPLELFLEKCGSQKLLFGTDLPWFDTHHGIGTVLSTDMSDEDRRNIFYRNGEKLLARQKLL